MIDSIPPKKNVWYTKIDDNAIYIQCADSLVLKIDKHGGKWHNGEVKEITSYRGRSEVYINSRSPDTADATTEEVMSGLFRGIMNLNERLKGGL